MPWVLLLFVFLSYSRCLSGCVVGLYQPFSRLLLVVLLASVFRLWFCMHQLSWHDKGEQYSATEQLDTSTVVRRLCGSAPHLEFANFLRMLLRAGTGALTFVTCWPYVSVLFRVTPRYTVKSSLFSLSPDHSKISFLLVVWFFRWKSQT